MNRTTAKNTTELFKRALADVAVAGFDIEVNPSVSFDGNSVTFKVRLKEKGTKDAAESLAEMVAKREGLRMQNERGDKIVEYKAQSPKFPWIVEKVDGSRWKFTSAAMKSEKNGFAA